MAIGDLFRPKHKHSRPEVRAQAVSVMDSDHLDLLIDVATHDQDAAVRKSAIEKIADPEILARVADSQSEPSLREHAMSLALGIWVSKAIHSDDEQVAKANFLQVVEHGDDRYLADIAGLSQHSVVRAQAVGRIVDEKALGHVVRKSQRMDGWQSALERIEDVQVLRGIAIDESRKQVAFAALERIKDVEVLEEIANKAKAKPIRNRARRAKTATLKGVREAEQAQKVEEILQVPNSEKQMQAERAQLIRTVEASADGSDWDESKKTVDELTARWSALREGCEEAEQVRFENALCAYNQRLRAHQTQEAARLAKSEKQEELKPQSSASTDSESPGSRSEKVNEVSTSEKKTKPDSDQDHRLDNQDDFEHLCDRLDELLEAKKIRYIDSAIKEIDEAKRKIGHLPKQVEARLTKRYDEVRRKALIYLGELREADDWKRWASVPKMEALIEKVTALLTDENSQKTSETLKSLQREWRELGPAPREKGDVLWAQFKSKCDEVYERVRAERQAKEQEQKENWAIKEALCQRAEELQSSTDWDETSIALKKLQSEWKKIGSVPRRKSESQWKRFRSACDNFFAARVPHLDQKLTEEADSRANKQALLEQISSIAATDVQTEDEVEAQINQVRECQREWRTLGRTDPKSAAALNREYKSICDKVYAKRNQIAEAKKAAAREVVSSLERMVADCSDAGWDTDPVDIAQLVLKIRQEYLSLDRDVPGYEALEATVNTLIREQLELDPTAYAGSILDPVASEIERKRLIHCAEELVPDPVGTAGQSPAEIADALRAALNDRALGGVLSKAETRTSAEIVDEFRKSWSRLSPVPGAVGAALQRKFDSACHRLLGEGDALSSSDTERGV